MIPVIVDGGLDDDLPILSRETTYESCRIVRSVDTHRLRVSRLRRSWFIRSSAGYTATSPNAVDLHTEQTGEGRDLLFASGASRSLRGL